MTIRVLPIHVANQIAAGEVVERPLSVVRELVDNALDAGATRVSIEVRAGGHALIRVVDDGSGMSPEDAARAFERHATSKLSTLSDLESIRTLGFRGEALPSIASVSKVRLCTRVHDAAAATEIQLAGGRVEKTGVAPAPVGTSVEVSNLFFNTPARRKFLKSQRSEELKIKQWLVQYSLAHPTVQFLLSFDDREVFRETARKSLAERARVLIGNSSVDISLQVNGILVEGVLAHPSLARGEVHALTVIVNDRLVSDRMILRAAKDGFGSALKDREFPVGALRITLDGREVDVNVHPQKSEIRFRNSSAVYVAVLRAVQAAVADFKAPMGAGNFGSGAGSSLLTGPIAGGAPAAASAPLFNQSVLPLSGSGPSTGVLADPHSSELGEGFRFQDLTYRGQLFECYLLCELEGRFVVVDMHAAHERYNYNRVRQSMRERERVSQKLLIPQDIALSEVASAHLKVHAPMLEAVGFGFEWPDSNTLRVTEIPSILVGRDVESTVRDIAALDPEEGGGQAPLELLVDQIAARIACHASIRSGKVMSAQESEALFALLDSSACSAACPHGRPVVVAFEQSQVEQWFGRDR